MIEIPALMGRFTCIDDSDLVGMKLLGVRTVLTIFLLITPLVLGTDLSRQITKEDIEYFPQDGWRTSTPEQQGMDSITLQDMVDYYVENNISIDGIIVVKNGYVVLEEYPSSYGRNSTHQLFSCTKSVTSTLFGIAVDNEYIRSVNERVLSYFENRSIQNVDNRKESITLKHLLTMSAGFEWTEQYRETGSDFDQMTRTVDWVQYVLDRPMVSEPGVEYTYNTGASHLLSAILQQSTGMSCLEFAITNLFNPLGITDYYWATDPMGISVGGSLLRLRPIDMAKIGYLYLRNGTWAERQIISPEWVNQASTSHINTTIVDGPGPVEKVGYGYQWWVRPELGAFSAFGWGGQSINIIPEHDVVVVVTAASSDPSTTSNWILKEWILPALGVNVNSSQRLDPLIPYIIGGSAALFLFYLIVALPIPIMLTMVSEEPEDDP
ncbi:MAG: serine hydrolase domain-containing protein [Candidatus Hodarchaeota archaeon]